MIERKPAAARWLGDRVLARTEETRALVAHPMKKLPARPSWSWGWSARRETDTGSAGRQAERELLAITDLGGAEGGELVLAEAGGTGRRAVGVKVVECSATRSRRGFSLIAIHKHGIPHASPTRRVGKRGRTPSSRSAMTARI